MGPRRRRRGRALRPAAECGAGRVRPEGLRGHDRARHRRGSRCQHRERVPPRGIQRRAPGHDHAVVRHPGSGCVEGGAHHRRLRCGAPRCPDVGEHQHRRPLLRRVQHPGGMAAGVAADQLEPGMVVRRSHARPQEVARRGHPSRRDRGAGSHIRPAGVVAVRALVDTREARSVRPARGSGAGAGTVLRGAAAR